MTVEIATFYGGPLDGQCMGITSLDPHKQTIQLRTCKQHGWWGCLCPRSKLDAVYRRVTEPAADELERGPYFVPKAS